MDAILFDFDGVLVDSEPIHFRAFAEVLASKGITLSQEDYYTRYLGYDDHDCFMEVAANTGLAFDEDTITAMIAEKTRRVQDAFAHSIAPQTGAVELVHAAETDAIPLAICSGALRQEVDLATQLIGVRDCFMAVVSAENVDRGKPDPQGYRLALEELCRLTGRVLQAGRTLVVEDSPAGIEAARHLGMRVLAVTTSRDRRALSGADLIVDSLAEVTLADLERRIFSRRR